MEKGKQCVASANNVTIATSNLFGEIDPGGPNTLTKRFHISVSHRTVHTFVDVTKVIKCSFKPPVLVDDLDLIENITQFLSHTVIEETGIPPYLRVSIGFMYRLAQE